MYAIVQIRQDGTMTLPASLRERYNIETGDTLRILDLDGILVLVPMVTMVPELAREIARAGGGRVGRRRASCRTARSARAVLG